MNNPSVPSHRCHGSPVVRKKEFQLEGFISLEEINLSRQKQNYGFYLFDKSWYLPAKHVIYCINAGFHYMVDFSLHPLVQLKFRYTLTMLSRVS